MLLIRRIVVRHRFLTIKTLVSDASWKRRGKRRFREASRTKYIKFDAASQRWSA